MNTQNTIDLAIQLAEKLQNQITHNISKQEKIFHRKMQSLLKNPENKVMLIELLDRGFRSKNNKDNFDLICHVFKKYGIKDFFTSFEKFLLHTFLKFGHLAPNISIPLFISQIRSDSKKMVLDSNPEQLKHHILSQKATINVNLIGEEVLGEEEAQYRLRKYKQAIQTSYIHYISIKITTIFSQINIIDFDFSKNEVTKRLKELYFLAQQESKKQNSQKFINLDMEEFRDLELTVSSFMEAIAEFKDLEAGIVLQAYIPDSLEYLKKLHAFSKQRVLDGGRPIKIRFVKGANMESEETIASQRGWALPTFTQKLDTDANYKKMLEFILSDENYRFIHIGIASHNLFEIAHALIQIQAHNAQEFFTFEMLEGMSIQASLELQKLHSLILYAPVCDDKHFNNAIAYLVRRLDENTSEDNFMRHFFNLKVNDVNWTKQKELFLASIKQMQTLDNQTKRTQDRNLPQSSIDGFTNEPDTDFILPQNRSWALQIKDKYSNYQSQDIFPMSTQTLDSDSVIKIHNRKNQNLIGTIYLASAQGINQALQIAKESPFSQKSFQEIWVILKKVANLFRQRRGDLIGIAAIEVGKTFLELDSEVSEAIDFLEFYPYSLSQLQQENPDTIFSPKGIGVTISPWNFPIGIPVGTIAAPLASGNRVIFKPSSLAPITAYKICECFWEAGIPKDALIYLPARGKDISEYLLSQDEISFCVLTGGEQTAYDILKRNPKLLLSAETGGKNATIVTKFADRDQAVKNVIHSAFSNSGQKCSATSLLILEKEVYEDENFKQTLKDAAQSLHVGDPFELKNKISYLAHQPNNKVTKALNELKDYEYWLLKPRLFNTHLLAPAIKYGTKEGDYTHQTELFAPILTVMQADNLEHAIHLANSTGYGLTGGLESLDEREWEYYLEHIEVGNVYINKPTTGAIVLRQPFGGIKKSAIGFGRKVGCFNYITQFLNLHQKQIQDRTISSKLLDRLMQIPLHQETKDRLLQIVKDYLYHLKNEFQTQKEFVKIRGEHNYFCYKKITNTLYRHESGHTEIELFSIVFASIITTTSLQISFEEQDKNFEIIQTYFPEISVIHEDISNFLLKISHFERIRYWGQCPKIYQYAALEGKVVIAQKPIPNGRFELLYYFNEQSRSISFHRYGNLGSQNLRSQK